MSHLGDRLTAMVDGELGHEARDRVLAHLTVCAECRAEAEVYRGLKARLGHLGGPSPSPDLERRLLGLAAPGGPMPRSRPPGTGRGSAGLSRGRAGANPFGGMPGPGASYEFAGAAAAPGPVAGPGPADYRPPSEASKGPARRRPGRMRYVLVGAVSLVALALSAGFAAGGQSAADQQVHRVAPPVDLYAVEHAATVGEVPVPYPGSSGPPANVILTDTGQ